MNKKEIISIAQDYAMDFGHSSIGTLHLMLSIMSSGKTGSVFFEKHNITIEKILQKADSLVGITSATKPSSTPIPLTPRAEHAFNYAEKLASKTTNPESGTHHLLLAIICDPNALASIILIELGADIELICEDVVNFDNANTSTDTSLTPMLNKYSRDLTKMARMGKLDPITTRENEVQELAETLCRRSKNNPCLVGVAGVGKTAVVEGFAQAIIAGNIPDVLSNARVLELDMPAILAGTKYRGDFEERIKGVLIEAKADKNIILFIDEIHAYLNSSDETTSKASDILKPAMARGEIKLIGATTTDEYKKFIEKDSALSRRFNQITIAEPSIPQTIEILKGVAPKYSLHYRIDLSGEVIEQIVHMADKYIPMGVMPDKALDLLDNICNSKAIDGQDNDRISTKILNLRTEAENCILNGNFSMAREISKKIAILEMNSTLPKIQAITKDDVINYVRRKTSVQTDSILNIEFELNDKVFGQPEAIATISQTLRRAYAGLKTPNSPLASFMFVGEKGSGKQLLAQNISNILFPHDSGLVVINCSEFSEESSVSKLIGTAPGYVGYNDNNNLFDKIKRNPRCVLFIQDVDVACKSVQNLFAQILNNGVFEQPNGIKIDFRKTIIIMTANVPERNNLGFGGFNSDSNSYPQPQNNALKPMFSDEFLDAFDNIINFSPLQGDALTSIALDKLNTLRNQLLQNSDIEFNFTPEVAERVAEMAKNPKEIDKVICDNLTNMLADKILSKEYLPGDCVFIDNSIFDNEIEQDA
ncbi:MAG: ATP-dependent Clp protease ATP-binding subunit [Clostridiales bacterium]|jgi:ATP-dependent Clp protease ATP-binding subunit ClpC|nr:ATP-dependent Clp protease ATP-binding subunit [Clostridiales bacterium]